MNKLVTIFIVIITLVNTLNMYIFTKQTLSLGIIVIKRLWSVVDFIIIVLNYFIVLNHFAFNIDIITIRVIEAILSVMLWFKSLYYLSLVGEIAPLVDIIFVIFSEIKYFMVIFIIGLFAFINAFYIIGRNQL